MLEERNKIFIVDQQNYVQVQYFDVLLSDKNAYYLECCFSMF